MRCDCARMGGVGQTEGVDKLVQWAYSDGQE